MLGVKVAVHTMLLLVVKPLSVPCSALRSASAKPLTASLKVMVTVEKYGNMSAATVPVSLVDALEQGRVKPGSLLLMPGFGGGLTFCSLLVRWGSRVTPLGVSGRELPPLTRTALEIVNEYRAEQDPHGRSLPGLMAPTFVEQRIR